MGLLGRGQGSGDERPSGGAGQGEQGQFVPPRACTVQSEGSCGDVKARR